MSEANELLSIYLQHLQARVRSQQGRWKPRDEKEQELANLPESVGTFCTTNPEECLTMIVSVLSTPALSPEMIRAVGDELLENLLNEHSGAIADQVLVLLRTNRRFRQAFSFGNHAAVDPAVVADWTRLFQNLGTTKAAERKSVWRRDA